MSWAVKPAFDPELVTPQLLPARLWSRLPAVAERLWSAADCAGCGRLFTPSSLLALFTEDPELAARRNPEEAMVNLDQIKVISLLEPVQVSVRASAGAAGFRSQNCWKRDAKAPTLQP